MFGSSTTQYFDSPLIRPLLLHELVSNVLTALNDTNRASKRAGFLKKNSQDDTAIRKNIRDLFVKLEQALNPTEPTDPHPTTPEVTTQTGFSFGVVPFEPNELISSPHSIDILLTAFDRIVTTLPITESTKNALNRAIETTFTSLNGAIEQLDKKSQQDLNVRTTQTTENHQTLSVLHSASSSRRTTPRNSQPSTPRLSGTASPSSPYPNTEFDAEETKSERKKTLRPHLTEAVINHLAKQQNKQAQLFAHNQECTLAALKNPTSHNHPVTKSLQFVGQLNTTTPLTAANIRQAIEKLSSDTDKQQLAIGNVCIDKEAFFTQLNLDQLQAESDEETIWRHLLNVLYPMTQAQLNKYMIALEHAINANPQIDELTHQRLLQCVMTPKTVTQILEQLETPLKTNKPEKEEKVEFDPALLMKEMDRTRTIAHPISEVASQKGIDCNAFDIQSTHDSAFLKALQSNEPLTLEHIREAINALPTNKAGSHILIKKGQIDKAELLQALKIDELETILDTKNQLQTLTEAASLQEASVSKRKKRRKGQASSLEQTAELRDETLIWQHFHKLTAGNMTQTQARLVGSALYPENTQQQKFVNHVSQYDFSYHGITTAMQTFSETVLSKQEAFEQAKQEEENLLITHILDTLPLSGHLFMRHTAPIVTIVIAALSHQLDEKEYHLALLEKPFTLTGIKETLPENSPIKTKLDTIPTALQDIELAKALIKLAPKNDRLKRRVLIMALRFHAELALEHRKSESTNPFEDNFWFTTLSKLLEEREFTVDGILAAFSATSDFEGNLYLNECSAQLPLHLMNDIKERLKLEPFKKQREHILYANCHLMAKRNNSQAFFLDEEEEAHQNDTTAQTMSIDALQKISSTRLEKQGQLLLDELLKELAPNIATIDSMRRARGARR